MEKRSVTDSNSIKTLKEETPVEVELVLLKNVILKTIGKVTGRVYVFNGAGSKLNVDERDAQALLSRNRGISCCSGNSASPYFEIVR